jgi:hypothetical protein
MRRHMVDVDSLFSGAGEADSKTRYASFTLRAQCAHCGGPLPLVGPIRAVTCAACSRATTISAKEWASILTYASTGFGSMNVGRHEVVNGKAPRQEPSCASCSAPAPLDKLAIGTDSTAMCACGATLTTYPPPSWLKEELPAIAQIYGADREPSADGIVVETSARALEPIVMACPKCGGALNLTTDSQRTTRCTFCQAGVYLPDDLWRSLHPVKTVRVWTIAFVGKLQTRSDIRAAEAKVAKAAAETRERKVTQARLAEAEQSAALASAADAKRSRTTMIAIGVVLLAIGAVVLIAATRG